MLSDFVRRTTIMEATMALALDSMQTKSSSALNSANFSAANASVAGVSAAQKTQSLDIH